MSWLRIFRRSRWDEERKQELASYVDLETDENVARGMTPDEARTAARRKLGNDTLVRENIYRFNTVRVVDAVWRDLRYAVRVLRRTPMWTAVAVLSLSLGIGANAAIFQLINAVKLRSLPIAHPETLVDLRIDNASNGRMGTFAGRRPMMTFALWEHLRANQTAVGQLLAWGSATFDLATGGESRFAQGLWVSGGFFSALDVVPVTGRILTPADDTSACASPAVVISEPFWQREFGGDPGVIGSSVRLDGHPFEIVGVTPAGFFGLEVGRRFEIAAPLCAAALLNPEDNPIAQRSYWWLSVMGRLPHGATSESATTALAPMQAAMFRATVPESYSSGDIEKYQAFHVGVFPASTGVSTLRRAYEQPLWVLLAIAGLVLLMACANLASIFLARAAAREREMAVRLAIGASRWQIARQAFVESLVIGFAGALVGIALAVSLSRTLLRFLSTDSSPLFLDLRVDWQLLGITAALAVVTSLIFGLAPALRASRIVPSSVMQSGGRGTAGARGAARFRRGLVMVQLALSVVLVTAALLFVRTLGNLATLDPGFRTDHVLVARVDLRRAAVPKDQLREFRARVLDRLKASPGVGSAVATAIVPLSGSGWNDVIVIDGEPRKTYPNFSSVSPGYFAALRIPLLTGRDFTRDDTISAPPVAVVNEAFARALFPTTSAIGRVFSFQRPPGTPTPAYQIVGVVGNTKYGDLREADNPAAYLADAQDANPGPYMPVLIGPAAPEIDPRASITAAMREINPEILVRYQMLEAQISASLIRERLMAGLAGGFGLIATLLGAVGLYGVMSYLIAQRTREIGVRIALGALRSQVVSLVLREAAVLVIVGVLAGVGLTMLVASASKTLLYGLEPNDAPTLIMAVAGLAVTAAIATALPARRAARLDPTTALRAE